MSVDASLKEIQKWMAVNRPMLQEIYQQFLCIYENHGITLKNTKSVYHDFCLHLYYNYVDDYGYTLFENQEEKNAHYARFRKPETLSSLSQSNKINTEEGGNVETEEAIEEIEFEEEED